MRLIDADALLPLLYARRDKYQKWLDDAEKQGKDNIYYNVMNMMIVVNACISEIINQPTINQMKKGSWISIFDEEESKCSECQKEYYYPISRGYNFCPNCGAKMEDPEDIPMEYFENGGM